MCEILQSEQVFDFNAVMFEPATFKQYLCFYKAPEILLYLIILVE